VLDVFGTVEDFADAVQQATQSAGSAQEASTSILGLAPAETADDDVTVVVVRRLPLEAAA
jgi:phosphoserine phosphatase RsbU/P